MPPYPRMALLSGSLLLASLLLASPARAWTEARVESAQASVEVDESGAAEVDLELLIYVRRGWLTSLTLAGFDPGLVLSEEQPPELRPVDAEFPVRRPDVRVRDDGSLTLSFPRRAGPHRGRYRLRLRYRSALLADPDVAGSARFTLPGFEAGLDGVELVFRAPLGTQLGVGSLPEATTEVEVHETDGRSVLSLRRAHVPRTVPWIVELILPHADAPALAASARPDAAQQLRGSRGRAPWALALLLVGLGLVRRRRYFARAARLGLKPSPLLPFVPPLVRDCILLIGALGYARALPGEPVASLVFLSIAVLVQLERVPSSLRPARPGAFEPVTRNERAGARRRHVWSHLGPDALLDATKPLGLLALGLLYVALCWLARGDAPSHQLAASVPFAALWLVPTFLSGHERTLPPDMHARIAWADATAEGLRSSGNRLRVLQHRATNGQVQDVRVDVELGAPEPGLLRLQLLLAASPGLSLTHVRAAALIVTRPQSPADLACARAFPHTSAWTSGDRRARLLPVSHDLEVHLEALGDALSKTRDLEGAHPIAPASTPPSTRAA